MSCLKGVVKLDVFNPAKTPDRDTASCVLAFGHIDLCVFICIQMYMHMYVCLLVYLSWAFRKNLNISRAFYLEEVVKCCKPNLHCSERMQRSYRFA